MPSSNQLGSALADAAVGASSFSAPATLAIGLSSTTPSRDATGITEPSGNGYARVLVQNNLTNWPAASAGAKSNAGTISFPQASGNWVSGNNLIYAVIWRHPTDNNATNFYAYGALAVAKPVLSGDIAYFAAGDFDWVFV